MGPSWAIAARSVRDIWISCCCHCERSEFSLARDCRGASRLAMTLLEKGRGTARPDALRGALKMIYRVVTYDRTTEHMKGSLIVPPSILARVKKIAGFQPRDDGLGEYALDEAQTRRVAKILGF